MSELSRCPNCSAELSGDYCSACGQKRIHPDSLSASFFFRETAREVTNLDLNFKTLRSLFALFRPGFLAKEYIQGRRASYLSPFKLYLVCAAICFAAASFAGYSIKDQIAEDPSRELMKLVSARMAERGIDKELFIRKFDLRVQTVFTIGMSVAILAFALVLQILFRRKMLPFGVHIIFSIYFVSFLYLTNPVVAVTIQAFRITSWWALAFNYGLIIPYIVVALKRVYSESVVWLIIKSGIFVIVTLVILAVANIGAILVTLKLI